MPENLQETAVSEVTIERFNGVLPELESKFEFYNFGHAYEILSQACQNEWSDLLSCLSAFEIPLADIRISGGNESPIPKRIDSLLYPKDWREIRITGDLLIKMFPRRAEQRGRFSDEPFDEKIITGYIDGHNIDFVKNKVAFDLEWNSKDQTFDRDLMAMRTYFDCGLIDVGVIMTRSEELNDIFREQGVLSKYGASTTWMGKLTYRLKSRRQGGCPILAIGIRKPCIVTGA
jgi:hypothetical protein